MTEYNTPPDKAALREIMVANHWYKQIARRLRVGKNALSMWLHGRSPSRRMDRRVPEIVRELANRKASSARKKV